MPGVNSSAILITQVIVALSNGTEHTEHCMSYIKQLVYALL